MKIFKHNFCSLKFPGFCFWLTAAAVSAAGMLFAAEADNVVSMVTYFPVPYAAYNNLYVSEKLDLGLHKDGNFELDLNSCNNATSLQAKEAVLWKAQTQPSGTLTLDAPLLVSQDAWFGKTAGAQQADLYFNQNLFIGKVENNTYSGGIHVKLAQSPTVRVLGDVHLFGASSAYALPKSCHSKVSWQNLSTKDGSFDFLVCGDVEIQAGSSGSGGETPLEPVACGTFKLERKAACPGAGVGVAYSDLDCAYCYGEKSCYTPDAPRITSVCCRAFNNIGKNVSTGYASVNCPWKNVHTGGGDQCQRVVYQAKSELCEHLDMVYE